MVIETIRDYKLDFFAISETGKANFSAPFLNKLSGGFDFLWYCLRPQGRSGGMLVGINSTSLHVMSVSHGDRCVKFKLRSKSDGFEWSLVSVYGAAQDDKRHEFLAELARICDNDSQPMLVGGDFNIIRRKEDKNNDNFDPRWPFMFNAIIKSLDLREIALSRRHLRGLVEETIKPTKN